MKKILLVDGSRTALLLEQMLLGGEGYELCVAANAREALAAAAAERPDLILMDVVLPGEDGLQALRTLRRRPETQATPVILLTTRGEPASVEEGWEAGCSEYVTKPIDAEELLTKVRSCMGA